MDPRMIPRNGAAEYNFGEQTGDARPNEPGVYYHPEADKFTETTFVKRSDGTIVYDQSTGKIQADAFVQLRYRLATADEVERYRKQQLSEVKSGDESAEDVTTKTSKKEIK